MTRTHRSCVLAAFAALSSAARPAFLVPVLTVVAAAGVLLMRAAPRASGSNIITVNTTLDDSTNGDAGS